MPMKKYKYKTVLLIDDSYIDNLISRKILQSSKFAENIIVKDSSQKAVEYIRESFANGHQIPEIIFLDLRMPDMSGFEFLKTLDTIPELNPEVIKIYVLSSSLDPKDFQRIKENKLVSNFIGKPLSKEILTEI